jgi:hypothetical protein
MHPFCLVTERVEVLPYALCLLLYIAGAIRDRTLIAVFICLHHRVEARYIVPLQKL